jgi:hypothetical protein
MPSHPRPHYTLGVSTRKCYYVLNAEVQVAEKSCLVAIDTRASVAIARYDIAAGLHERELTRPYFQQMASWDTLPVLKGALVGLTLGRRPLRMWVFVPEVTVFTLGLDVLRAHHAS